MDSEPIQRNDNAEGRSLRLLRPSIVVLCGPAACGKSTFAEKHFRPTQIISSDWARARVCDDERDQRYNSQAFALVHFLIDQRLLLNRLCVVDSTAVTAQARKDLLDLAKKYQVPTTLMCFNVPLETCLERDEKRERTVGRANIERQHELFALSKATIASEGFDQIVELQEGDIDKVRVEILFRPAVRPGQRPRSDGNGARRSERLPPVRPRFDSGGNGHASPVTKIAPAQPLAVRAVVASASSIPARPKETPAAAVPTNPPASLPRPDASVKLKSASVLAQVTTAPGPLRPAPNKLPLGGQLPG